MKTIKKNHCKHTRRGHNSKCSCKICRCRRGGTKSTKLIPKATKTTRKSTSRIFSPAEEEKIAHMHTVGLNYRENSFIRAFSKYIPSAVKEMDHKMITIIYINWRSKEAIGRKINRTQKKTGKSASDISIQNNKEELAAYNKAVILQTEAETSAAEAAEAAVEAVEAAEAAEALIEMNTHGYEDFPVSPINTLTLEGADLSGFTPNDRKKTTAISEKSTDPKTLFKFSPLKLGTREDEEDEIWGLLGVDS
jgi:hypothetical protein